MKRLLAVLLTLAAPAVAQTLQPGQIVLLRSPGGKYLSARHGQALRLVGSAGAAEQWQYSRSFSEPARFLSYDGGALIVRDPHGSPTPIHAPVAAVKYGSDDTTFGRIEVYADPRFPQTVFHYVHDDEPVVLGVPFVIKSRQFGQMLCEGSGILNMQPAGHSVNLKTSAPITTTAPECAWTAVSAGAIEPGRSALRTSLVNGDGPAFRSAHGTLITQGLAIERERKALVHASPEASLLPSFGIWDPEAGRSRPVFYGQDIWLVQTAGDASAPSWFVVPNAQGQVELFASQRLNTFAWRIVDPSHVRSPGDRVAWYDRVALFHPATGRYLSADPARPQLFLAPHANKWELWTIVGWP